MSKQRLRVWRTAGLSSVLALRSIGIFPFAWLLVVAVLIALRFFRLPDLPVWESALRMIARSAVLTSFAIVIHRWIVLGERENSYRAIQPFRESFHVTTGSSWRIFFVFFIIGTVDLLFFMVADHFLGSAMRRSLWIGAGWTVENTIVFAIYVAVASHLWRTRGDWSDRGSAAAAAWTTPTIP